MNDVPDDDLLDDMARCLIPWLRYCADRELHNERRPSTCIKVDCKRPPHARGFCGPHYSRALKRGKILDVLYGLHTQ